MKKALVIDGVEYDTKIRFELVNGDECNSLYFYNNQNQVQYLDEAINVRFLPQSGNSGYTFYGSNKITQRGPLPAYLNGSNDFWSYGDTYVHEFGHTRNLKHSFNCTNPCDGIDFDVEEQCCGACCNSDSGTSSSNCPGINTNGGCWNCSDLDLMMAYDPGSNMTICETKEMWSYIVNNDEQYQIMCSQPNTISEIEYDFNTSISWDNMKLFDSDVRIKSGTHVTANCNVYFTEGKQLTIEEGASFTLEGGTMSSYCGGLWKGIKIEGKHIDYSVIIHNNSTIENTSEAAVSMFASGGWLLGDGDAEVKIENSTFNNCHRMLAMGSSTNTLNESIISNNVQNGGKYGVTNWNCRGVHITDNTFNNISNECIVTEHGQFTIERNTFNSGRADILFANTNPGFGTDIWTNQFNGSNTGIRALGASLGQHRIKTNQFFTGEFDIFMDGDNNYRIEENDFTSDFAITSIDNGLHSNDVLRNNISGNFIGLVPLGDNSNYLFYDNCFNTSFTDSWIEGQVNDPQAHGENLGAANNCFTHGGNVNHPTNDIDGSPNLFTYNEPSDSDIDCRDAIKAETNGLIDIDDSNGEVDSPCGSVGSGIGSIPPSTQFNPCNPPKDITITWDAISWLKNKLQQIESDPNLTDEQEEYYSDIYERCLQRVKWQWVQLVIEAERYEDARTYLTSEGSNDALLAIYATYVSENDLNGARQYLNGINSNDEAVLDFIAIQMINLDRLENGRVFTSTPNQLQFVETIANKKHPYAGYAKALYYWLTSEILVSDMPDFDGRGSKQRSANSDKINSNIYPNPFQNQLTIEIESGQDLKLEITDLFGKVYTYRNIDKSTIINTSRWKTGVYIASLWSDGNLIKQEKVVLAR